MTIIAMFICTLLIIGIMGGKEKFMTALGVIFLTALVGVVVLGLASAP